MSAATAPAPVGSGSARRFPRLSVATPVDVVILRSGVPDSIPGRSLNLSEGGMAAIVAAELRPGQPVAIQVTLPNLPSPVRARAIVKHQIELLCGLEFQGLSAEQRAILRSFSGQAASDDSSNFVNPNPARTLRAAPSTLPIKAGRKRNRGIQRQHFWAVLAIPVLIMTAGWWRWHLSWEQLEKQISSRQEAMQETRVSVPTDQMQKLLVHRVDPIYPESARPRNLRGLVLLSAVVGKDGSVLKLQPLSGPELLTSAAAEAVRWWRFQPYEVSGRPTEVETTLAVEFTP